MSYCKLGVGWLWEKKGKGRSVGGWVGLLTLKVDGGLLLDHHLVEREGAGLVGAENGHA